MAKNSSATYRVPHHGVRLARASLSVREHGRVVALERRLQHFRAQLLEDLEEKRWETETRFPCTKVHFTPSESWTD